MTTFVPGQILTAAQLNLAVDSVTLPESFGAVSGSVSGAQRIANVAAIQAAYNAANASNGGGGGVVQLGPVTYQLDGTVKMLPGANNKCSYLNGIKYVTRLEQWNAAGGIDTVQFGGAIGAPILGGEGGGVTNIWFVEMVDHSTTAPSSGSNLGALLAVGTGEFNEFGHLYFGEVNLPIASTTGFPYKAIAQDPAGTPFSCYYHDIQIKGFGHIGWDAVGSDSGSYHCNIQIRNGGLGESPLKISTGPALWIGNSQGIWDQLNLEWSHFDGFNVLGMVVTQSAGVKFGHLHIEGLQFSNSGGNTSGGIIGLFGFGDCKFDSIHIISTNLSTPANLPSFGVFTGGFNANGVMTIVVGQLEIIQTLTLGTGVNFYLVNTINGSTTVDQWMLDFNGPMPLIGDGSFSAKLTNWSNCSWLPNGKGPANGLGVPPTNLRGKGILSITTSAYGYSAGVFTASMLDGNDTYIWNAGTNGTVVLPLTVMDAAPVTLPPYPGMEREVVNPTGGGNTTAVHDSAATNLLAATNLTAGKFARFRFNGSNWIQINAGTLL